MARARRIAESLERRLIDARIDLELEPGHTRRDIRKRIKAITKELEAAEGRLVELIRSTASEKDDLPMS